MLAKIVDRLQSDKLILFVGSGMSAGCYPTWGALLKELIAELLVADPDAKAEAEDMVAKGEFLQAAWVVQHKVPHLQLHLSKKFKPLPCPAVEARYRRIDGLPFASIFTTNYDHFLNEGRSVVTQSDALGDVLDQVLLERRDQHARDERESARPVDRVPVKGMALHDLAGRVHRDGEALVGRLHPRTVALDYGCLGGRGRGDRREGHPERQACGRPSGCTLCPHARRSSTISISP